MTLSLGSFGESNDNQKGRGSGFRLSFIALVHKTNRGCGKQPWAKLDGLGVLCGACTGPEIRATPRLW